jgi:hypothetical protein
LTSWNNDKSGTGTKIAGISRMRHHVIVAKLKKLKVKKDVGDKDIL